MTPFETYRTYRALTAHFTSSYDYFKYNGRVKVNRSSFENRNDNYYFEKLSRRIDPAGFILANIVEHGQLWIGDLVSDEQYITTYLQWVGRKQSLDYRLKNQMDKYKSLDHALRITNHYPPLLEDLISGEINSEIAIIVNSFTGCFSYWNQKLKDDIIWQQEYFKLKKYTPFVNFNRAACKKVLVNLWPKVT